ncbi:MAG TPA: hypothetical protein EYQ31_18345, partial [Candidatus Handelsmanbacteria bacterium]|nr:hypothetical protein [Candidatus Handelsmanbacteria bacterium]
LIIGKIADVPVAILSRHGPGHKINPTNVNYRANVWSLKEEGCTHILAVTACGSLRERIEPGHFVFPDQFIDRTAKRISTYFDGSDVQHVSMGEPFSSGIRNCLVQACTFLGFDFHDGGTVDSTRYGYRTWPGQAHRLPTEPGNKPTIRLLVFGAMNSALRRCRREAGCCDEVPSSRWHCLHR